MKNITVILLSFFLFLPVISYSNQDNTDLLAENFLIVTKQKEQNNKVIEMLKTRITRQMNMYVRSGNLDEKKRELLKKYSNEIMTILVEEMAWEKIKGNHIEIIKSIYSDEELRSLIKFFESDLGKLYVNKQQIAIQKIGESSQKSVQNLMIRIKTLEQNMKTELSK